MTYMAQEKEYLKRLQAIPDEVRGGARVVSCMAGTRRDILDTVTAWLQNPDAQNILWGELGSFYVFKQGNATLADPVAVWRTIVHDLVDMPFPSRHEHFHVELRRRILTLLQGSTFDAGSRDVEAQFEALIQEPMKDLGVSGFPVIVIDALDECGTQSQLEFQMFLRTLVSWSRLPRGFRLVVTGRNVHSIEEKLVPMLVST
ncbi:hypothetical protein BD779DRAFT_1118008 [Infundibulicybe gibba]|nr:hypothetical protein BD779DRAFT_1118008 [Infundibulicybe gibba]